MRTHYYAGPAIPEPAETYRTPAPQRSMTTARAAEILDTTDRHVRRLIAQGDLGAFRLGRALRVRESDIVEFQERRTIRPTLDADAA